MCTGPVTAGDKQRTRIRDGIQRCRQVRRALGRCRIGGWANDHEIIIHHVISGISIALGNKLLLERLAVYEQNVTVTIHCVLHSSTGPDRDDAHPQISFLFESREKVFEQPGIFGRSRRLDDKGFLAGQSQRGLEKNGCGNRRFQ